MYTFMKNGTGQPGNRHESVDCVADDPEIRERDGVIRIRFLVIHKGMGEAAEHVQPKCAHRSRDGIAVLSLTNQAPDFFQLDPIWSLEGFAGPAARNRSPRGQPHHPIVVKVPASAQARRARGTGDRRFGSELRLMGPPRETSSTARDESPMAVGPRGPGLDAAAAISFYGRLRRADAWHARGRRKARNPVPEIVCRVVVP